MNVNYRLLSKLLIPCGFGIFIVLSIMAAFAFSTISEIIMSIITIGAMCLCLGYMACEKLMTRFQDKIDLSINTVFGSVGKNGFKDFAKSILHKDGKLIELNGDCFITNNNIILLNNSPTKSELSSFEKLAIKENKTPFIAGYVLTDLTKARCLNYGITAYNGDDVEDIAYDRIMSEPELNQMT